MASERPQREQRFERRMSDAEALMWNVEKDPWLNPSGGTMMLLDRPPDIDHFRAQIAAAVANVPRLRERVVPGFGRFSPPTWKTDGEFNLDYHIRSVALPAPGSMRQLLDLVGQVYEDPYDRTRPLWMFYVIEGLEHGRAALVWKIHHTVADGIGAGRLAEGYLQRTRKAPKAPAADLDAVVAAAVAEDSSRQQGSSFAGSLLDTIAHSARRQAGIARRTVGEVAAWGTDPLRALDAAGNAVRTIGQLRSQLGGGGPASPDGLPSGSPIWRQRSRHRRLEVLSFSLEEAIAAAKALGGSLNDWFVTGAVNGVVRYHDARGVELHSLNTSFIVSTRTDRAIGGNSFTPSRLTVPAGPMKADERFGVISAAMQAKRADVSGQGLLGAVAGVANLLPTSIVTSVARSRASKMDFVTSNLRGAKTRLYISGARVDGNHPFGPLAGTAFNLTMMSYAGGLDMGLLVDPVAIDHPEDLRDHLDVAYRQLIDTATM